MAGQRQRMTLDHRAVLAVVHPGPRGLMPRNAHDVAGAAAVERTDQGDMERDQLQGGALDDSKGANEAAQSASGVPVQAGAEHRPGACRSEEHTSELQSLMRNSYALLWLKKKKHNNNQ